MTTAKSDLKINKLVKCSTLKIGDLAIVGSSLKLKGLVGCIIMKIFHGIVVLDNNGNPLVKIGSHYQWDTTSTLEQLNVLPLESGESVTLIS